MTIGYGPAVPAGQLGSYMGQVHAPIVMQVHSGADISALTSAVATLPLSSHAMAPVADMKGAE